MRISGRAQPYLLSAAVAVVAILVHAALRAVGVDLPVFAVFPAVVLAAGWWGLGPGLLATGVALLGAVVWLGTGGALAGIAAAAGLVATALLAASIHRVRARTDDVCQQLARLLDSTSDAVMVFDREWRYLYVNRQAAAFAQRPPEELLGRRLVDLFADIRQVPFFAAAEKAMRERVPVSVESYYAPLDKWFANDIYPVEDGISVFYRDVTARRRAADAVGELLQQERTARSESETANRLKDEFLTTLSHELRTPLAGIVGWARLLGDERLPPERRAEAIEAIYRNARAQARLVEELLDVSRLISGKLHLQRAAVDLPTVVEEALDAIRPGAAAKTIAIAVAVEPRLPTVYGDATRLQQAAWNLLANSVKFTPPGGRIEVDLRPAASGVELVVRDTGTGIPPHMLERVFERFVQVDSAITPENRGLGLGLSLVRHIVEAHGGSVVAASEGEGRGVTMTVRLPAVGVGRAVESQASRA